MITALSPKHLTTSAGVAEAFRALVDAEKTLSLPRPVEAHPVPALGRMDVHLSDDAALSAWAAAFGVPIVDHDGAVHQAHMLLAGHHYELWTRPACQLALDLRAAAALIRAEGWFHLGPSGLCMVNGGGNCLMTAISRATFSKARLEAAHAAVCAHIDVALSPYRWNDTPGRTVDDVLDLLELCAADAEAGAR